MKNPESDTARSAGGKGNMATWKTLAIQLVIQKVKKIWLFLWGLFAAPHTWKVVKKGLRFCLTMAVMLSLITWVITWVWGSAWTIYPDPACSRHSHSNHLPWFTLYGKLAFHGFPCFKVRTDLCRINMWLLQICWKKLELELNNISFNSFYSMQGSLW